MCSLGILALVSPLFFFFNDTATTEIYTLSLHDALPISRHLRVLRLARLRGDREGHRPGGSRSEEHTSELQSRSDLVCRLLLEKKKISRTFSQPTSHTHSPTWSNSIRPLPPGIDTSLDVS